jgi:hypothetical protein
MKKFLSGQTPTYILLALSLLLGVLTLTDYGESWDERQFYRYADHALESYTTWLQRGEIIVTGNTYDNYGPAFVIFASGIARGLHTLNPGWLISDLRHLVYFITFLAGVWAFHKIAQRWMSPLASFAVTALFITQPLFWGHAFFSPKDIPFMSLFLLCLSFGFEMVDAIKLRSFDPPTPANQRTLWLPTTLWLATVILFFAATGLIHSAISNLVVSAASGETNIVSLVASDIHTAAPEVYIRKYFLLFIRVRATYFYLSTCLLVYLYYRHFPSAFRLMSSVACPAILLGVTTSIRILAPLAGLLIGYFALRILGKKSLPILAVYAVIAIVTMYFTWPYLWPDPLRGLLESLAVMSQYPWKGQVLFNGQYYASTALPYSYLPVLLAVQFTEPVWPLFLIGILALRRNNFVLFSALSWFVLPLTALIVLRAPFYDNTRQIFFILPPVFLVAGLGVEWLLNRIARPEVRALIVVLAVLPGLVAGIRLHPYEYVYYNSLVPEPEGRFELDYWATSYREAVDWLNVNAPANANVLAVGPAHIAELYARADLTVRPDPAETNERFDYVIITSRYDYDRTLYPDSGIVQIVGRDGMTFTVIKRISR